MTPGADVLLVAGSALRGRARAGILTALGISLGSIIWTLLVAIGLVALLQANASIYDLLTFAGVLYMLYVGVGEVRGGLSGAASPREISGISQPSSLRYVTKGLAVNLLNPKVGIFYLTFLPQFVPNGQMTIGNTLILGGIHVVLGIIWLSFCSFAIDKAQAMLNSPRVSNGLMIVAGVLIIAFALFVLWNRFA